MSKQGLPTPILYRSIFQARYKPDLEIYDRLLPAARNLDFPHWRTDRLRVTVFDPSKRCSISIAFDSFSYTQDSHDVQQEAIYLGRITESLPNELNIKGFTRFGFRRWYLIPVTFSFESLVPILDVKLCVQDDRLRAIIPSKTVDLSSIIVSSDDKYSTRIAIGPMRKAEIPLNVPFDREHHAKSVEDYADFVKGYPEVCVYVDIDYFQEDKEAALMDGASFVTAARAVISKMLTDLNNYLFSSKVKA